MKRIALSDVVLILGAVVLIIAPVLFIIGGSKLMLFGTLLIYAVTLIAVFLAVYKKSKSEQNMSAGFPSFSKVGLTAWDLSLVEWVLIGWFGVGVGCAHSMSKYWFCEGIWSWFILYSLMFTILTICSLVLIFIRLKSRKFFWWLLLLGTILAVFPLAGMILRDLI